MINKNLRAIILSGAVLLMLSLISCDPTKKLEKQEREDIQAYLTQNSTLQYVKQPSGLYYLEVIAGTGISPVRSDSAYVKYKGMFLNGSVFDSSELYGFIVGENLTGFDEGVTLMKPGGKSSLLIPSKLGYGASGNYNSISGFTPLLFDIELVKIAKYSVDWYH